MNWFEKVDRYYKDGLYTKEQVGIFVQTGKITKEEYKIIIGENYEI